MDTVPESIGILRPIAAGSKAKEMWRYISCPRLGNRVCWSGRVESGDLVVVISLGVGVALRSWVRFLLETGGGNKKQKKLIGNRIIFSTEQLFYMPVTHIHDLCIFIYFLILFLFKLQTLNHFSMWYTYPHAAFDLPPWTVGSYDVRIQGKVSLRLLYHRSPLGCDGLCHPALTPASVEKSAIWD